MEPTNFDYLAEGTSIPEIVVNSLKMMVSGVTESIRDAFDGLVLNEAKNGLSALAIWTLTFIGIGFLWKIIPMGIRFFKRRR